METLVNGLRRSFEAGNTRPYEWRVAQLEGILRMMKEREKEIVEALWADLAKPQTEAYLHEISLSKAGCKFALKNLKNWMQPEKVITENYYSMFPYSIGLGRPVFRDLWDLVLYHYW